MPRTPGYTDGATPPSYVTRAYQFDNSWTKDAVCRGHNKPGSPFQHAWTADPGRNYMIGEGEGAKKVSGEMLLQIGLTFCAMCPVQWDCTTWALDVKEPLGTWGVSFGDLEWLRKQRHPKALIELARQRGDSVQTMVEVRRMRVKPVRV